MMEVPMTRIVLVWAWVVAGCSWSPTINLKDVADDTDVDTDDVEADETDLSVGTSVECGGDPATRTNPTPWFLDGDQDGLGDPSSVVMACRRPSPGWVEVGGDCNDFNPDVHEGTTEICDGIDDDCDGLIDDDDPSVDIDGTMLSHQWFIDRDNDSFGDHTENTVLLYACAQPLGYVNNQDDCDDRNPAINDFAQEEPADGVDQNCDGFEECWCDGDSDSYGVDVAVLTRDVTCQRVSVLPGDPVPVCHDVTNRLGDCDDDNPDYFPGNIEGCDGRDNDCDGLIDDEDPSVDIDETAPDNQWFIDRDNDRFGDKTVATVVRYACAQPLGYVNNQNDCDDRDATVNDFAQEEPADDVDQNCDGFEECWCDRDSDAYGIQVVVLTRDVTCNVVSVQPGDPAPACPDVTDLLGDCEDDNPDNFPGNIEDCDNQDNDCDGLIDGADGGVSADNLYFRDRDGDGYGNPGEPTIACVRPIGYAESDINHDGQVTADEVDCDDQRPSAHPHATEIVANGIDENCDQAESCWFDEDDDGFGARPPAGQVGATRTSSQGDLACVGPQVSATQDDCDDTDGSIQPGSVERCDPNDIDEDCDGLADDDDTNPLNAAAWYSDGDHDGFGGYATPVFRCDRPPGYAERTGDCDDTLSWINPDGVEVCDGFDDDCDGGADDNDDANVGTAIDYLNPAASHARTWYPDADGDGDGEAIQGLVRCAAPPRYVNRGGDCDDSNPEVYSGAVEIFADGVDQNCDGDDACRLDADGDGFGSSAAVNAPLVPGSICQGPHIASNSDDCDDHVAAVNPTAPEICDSKDNDCDRLIDDRDNDVSPAFNVSAPDAYTWTRDGDGDGFGDPSDVVYACVRPVGYVTEVGTSPGVYAPADCDDYNRLIHPGAHEDPADGVDENCNGLEACYWDGDLDGLGVTPSPATPIREAPSGRLDCSDGGYSANTDDCDDTNAATGGVQAVWFHDADGDLEGNPSVFVLQCRSPGADWTTVGTDCDDNNRNVNRSHGAQEICDAANEDEDCDGLVEDADPSVVAGTRSTWYVDADGDRYGGSTSVQRCDPTPTQVAASGDCNDADAGINPAAIEVVADNVDGDCDGTELCYCNKDGDALGISSSLVAKNITTPPPAGNVCAPPASPPASPAAICSSTTVAIVPGDCDDSDKNSVTEPTIRFLDDDGDGFGNPNVYVFGCEVPRGTWVTNPDDCNDDNAAVKPFAVEVCDLLDNDCDGQVDEGVSPATYWQDADADTFGNPNIAVTACAQPAGFVAAGQADCNDVISAIKPGAAETCDGLDNDCDGGVDEGLVINVYWRDADLDTYGNPSAAIAVCNTIPPAGYVVPTRPDCDDASSTRKPSVPELCNGIDDNCNGGIDEPPITGGAMYYADFDGDGFGLTGNTVTACAVPPGYALISGDCVDAGGQDRNPLRHPGRPEVCDGIDNDCNTRVDDDPVDAVTLWEDNDNDGFGDPSTAAAGCPGDVTGVPPGVPDCDDTSNTVFPGAGERCNAIDDDCNVRVDDGAYCGPLAYGFEDVATGTAYQLVEQQLSWDGAEDYCDAIGYHLAWLETATEEANVGTAVGAQGVTQFWLGYYREPANWRRAEGPSTTLATTPIGAGNETTQISGASNSTNTVIRWASGTWSAQSRTSVFAAFVCEAPP